MTNNNQEYIASLESDRTIDKNCKFCNQYFYPELVLGRRMNDIFAPRHIASRNCESGKRAHCTCDTCF